MDKKITIIVTVYNKFFQIENCIKSLLNQIVNDFDVLIVDDGSTDGSFEIIKHTVQGSSRITVFTINHQGVASARNFALTKANTEYVVFLDGDDSLCDNAIETLLRYLTEYSSDLVVYGFSHVMKNEKLYSHSSKNIRYCTKQEILKSFTQIWNSRLMYSVCNKLFRNRF